MAQIISWFCIGRIILLVCIFAVPNNPTSQFVARSPFLPLPQQLMLNYQVAKETGSMSRQYFQETLAVATQDGTAVANTTTEAAIFPAFVLPANYMQDGRLLRMRAFGKLSTTGTPAITFAIRWGTAVGTLLATTEALTMGSGVANVNWDIEAFIQVRSNGATGTLLVMGDARVHTSSTTTVMNIFGVSGFDAPAAVTVDLTADTNLALTADWSAQSASNTLTGLIFVVESLN